MAPGFTNSRMWLPFSPSLSHFRLVTLKYSQTDEYHVVNTNYGFECSRWINLSYAWYYFVGMNDFHVKLKYIRKTNVNKSDIYLVADLPETMINYIELLKCLPKNLYICLLKISIPSLLASVLNSHGMWQMEIHAPKSSVCHTKISYFSMEAVWIKNLTMITIIWYNHPCM